MNNQVVKRSFAFWNRPWAALAGVLMGVAIAESSVINTAWQAYDQRNPVVRMSAYDIQRGQDNVLLRMRGRKIRDCVYITIRAYSVRNGVLHEANIERVDLPQDGSTKPPGKDYDLGLWRVHPVDQFDGVEVYVKHSCNGRLVTTRIAEVKA